MTNEGMEYNISIDNRLLFIVFEGDCWKSEVVSFNIIGMTVGEIRDKVEEEVENNRKEDGSKSN